MRTKKTQASAPRGVRQGSRQRRDTLTAALFLSPAAIGLIVFMIVPFMMAFYLSLTDTRLMSPNPPEFIGFKNYRDMLRVKLVPLEPELDAETGWPQRDADGELVYPRARTILRGDDAYKGLHELRQVELFDQRYIVATGDPLFWKGLANNFRFVLVVVPVQTAFALLLGLLVNQKMRGANVYRALYFTPVVTSMVVVSVIWFFLFNPGQGTINAFLETITFGRVGPQNWLTDPRLAFPSIMLMSIWQGVGFQMVIFVAGLQEISPEIYEAASIDGCNKLQEFVFMTLPQLRNTTIFVVLATTILAFQLFTQVDVMTGGGPSDATLTTILHVVNQGRRQMRAGYASAITVVFFLIVLVISIVQRVVVREERAVQ
jgi:multiple sugar transport system permease protein